MRARLTAAVPCDWIHGPPKASTHMSLRIILVKHPSIHQNMNGGNHFQQVEPQTQSNILKQTPCEEMPCGWKGKRVAYFIRNWRPGGGLFDFSQYMCMQTAHGKNTSAKPCPVKNFSQNNRIVRPPKRKKCQQIILTMHPFQQTPYIWINKIIGKVVRQFFDPLWKSVGTYCTLIS